MGLAVVVWDTPWAFLAYEYGLGGMGWVGRSFLDTRSVDDQTYLQECDGARGPARMRCVLQLMRRVLHTFRCYWVSLEAWRHQRRR